MGQTQAPVTISIVGTGDVQGGGVAPTPDGTIAKTPVGQPNLRINVVTPIIAILVRFVHLFLTTFVGVLTAAGIGAVAGIDSTNMLAVTDLAGALKNGAWIGLSVGAMGGLKDLVTVFGRLEGRYPLISGSI